MKVAFVHIMRTGGTYALTQFKHNNWNVINSWDYGLERDWKKREALEIASLDFEENSVFHNHVANWDLDIVRAFKENGWTIFSIFREPLPQLISLHSFLTTWSIYDFKLDDINEIEINDFIKKAINKKENLGMGVDFSHWEIPDWRKEIDIVLDYKQNLFSSLKNTFGLDAPCYIQNINSFGKSKNISQKSLNLVQTSDHQKKYDEFKGESKTKIFVLITSCEKNEEYRSLLRRGWIKDLTCPYLFVIGDESGPTRIEEDILYVHCGDAYEDCPIKQYLSIKYVNTNFDFDHLFCCDDDTYVVVDRLMESGFENHDYYGGGPVHEQGDPHYVQGGAGIFLSQKAIQAIVEYPIDGDHLKCRWSDQMVGKIMHDAGIDAVYNTRFQMGHEKEIEWMSRDYNRLISAHKLELWQLQHAIFDVNPFHSFDQIYCIKTDLELYSRMEWQLEDNEIDHLTKTIEGDYRDAVRDAIENKHEKILILKDDDVFIFKMRDFSRFLFEEIRDWEVMCLGAEAKIAQWPTSSVFSSKEVYKFSGLGLHEDTFESFLKEKDIEKWMKGREVFYPKRPCSTKNGEWFHGPEIIVEKELERPVRCALIVRNFKRGGAEIEFNEMITRLDPEKVEWVGVASESAYELEVAPDYKDKFCPIYVANDQVEKALDLEGAIICPTFEDAILQATRNADVVIKWHVKNAVAEKLPHPSILLSNTFGRWIIESYKEIWGDIHVGNSVHSGNLFWNNVRPRVIYSGHAIERLKKNLGRDKQREQWGFNSKDKLIGYIGRIDMDKNLKTMIKAVAILPDEYKLVFMGQAMDEIYEETETMLNKYLPERHRVLPWSHYVGDALSALDCFVLVSHYEGFSNSLAEAWMMDVPTVFSRCGAVMELEEKYGDIGISTNVGVKPKELSHKIMLAMSDGNKPIVKKIGKIMRENFTLEESAKQWESAIIDCYNTHKKREKLKVGLLVSNSEELKKWESVLKYSCPISTQWQVFCNNKLDELNYCEFFFEEDRFTIQMRKCDIMIVHGVEDFSKWMPESFEKPIMLVASESVKDCHLATKFVALDKKDVKHFPKIIQKSVTVMQEPEEVDWTLKEVLISQKWNELLFEIYENFEYPDLVGRIKEMLEDHPPKRVARQLNRDQVPPPDDLQEWTYKSVLDFVADS